MDTQISSDEIWSGLKNLDVTTGPGPDGIALLFLQNLSTELTTPLFLLFNMSLESGEFPEEWKQPFLIPIYKSGKKSDIRNYRGIAIIFCIPKL